MSKILVGTYLAVHTRSLEGTGFAYIPNKNLMGTVPKSLCQACSMCFGALSKVNLSPQSVCRKGA